GDRALSLARMREAIGAIMRDRNVQELRALVHEAQEQPGIIKHCSWGPEKLEVLRIMEVCMPNALSSYRDVLLHFIQIMSNGLDCFFHLAKNPVADITDTGSYVTEGSELHQQTEDSIRVAMGLLGNLRASYYLQRGLVLGARPTNINQAELEYRLNGVHAWMSLVDGMIPGMEQQNKFLFDVREPMRALLIEAIRHLARQRAAAFSRLKIHEESLDPRREYDTIHWGRMGRMVEHIQRGDIIGAFKEFVRANKQYKGAFLPDAIALVQLVVPSNPRLRRRLEQRQAAAQRAVVDPRDRAEAAASADEPVFRGGPTKKEKAQSGAKQKSEKKGAPKKQAKKTGEDSQKNSGAHDAALGDATGTGSHTPPAAQGSLRPVLLQSAPSPRWADMVDDDDPVGLDEGEWVSVGGAKKEKAKAAVDSFATRSDRGKQRRDFRGRARDSRGPSGVSKQKELLGDAATRGHSDRRGQPSAARGSGVAPVSLVDGSVLVSVSGRREGARSFAAAVLGRQAVKAPSSSSAVTTDKPVTATSTATSTSTTTSTNTPERLRAEVLLPQAEVPAIEVVEPVIATTTTTTTTTTGAAVGGSVGSAQRVPPVVVHAPDQRFRVAQPTYATPELAARVTMRAQLSSYASDARGYAYPDEIWYGPDFPPHGVRACWNPQRQQYELVGSPVLDVGAATAPINLDAVQAGLYSPSLPQWVAMGWRPTS
ncbi:MAG: hypothetical protein B7X06_01105, partial [Verrucomicrobia bacterium 21-51-4]